MDTTKHLKNGKNFRYLTNIAAVCAFASVGPDAISGCACVIYARQ